jgi:predicted 3-demethylubiquinone-9 3-methyltransferase (glyoxalase superfamily)
MTIRQRIAPCLWFDHQAEEAARFYTGIFPNSKVGRISRYGEAGREFHRKEPGTVMTVEFELDGQPFTALNGGPEFRFKRGDLAAGELRHAGADIRAIERAVAGEHVTT